MRNSERLILAFGDIDSQRIEHVAQELGYTALRVKPRRRLSKLLLIAAVVVMLLALSAFALYQFYVADAFRSYFGDLNENQAAVMESMGAHDLEPIAAPSGNTVTPLALIGNEDAYYIRLRFEAPEGQVLNLPDSPYSFYQILSPDEIMDIFTWEGNRGGLEQRVEFFDETPNDNAVECVVAIRMQYMRHMDVKPGRLKTLHIQNLYLQHPDKEYSVVLEGPWDIDLSNRYEPSRSLPVEGLKAVNPFGEEMTLRSMYLSPLAIGFGYDFSLDGNDINSQDYTYVNPVILDVVLKDGSKAAYQQGDCSTGSSSFDGHCFFEQPIDITQVDYIQFADLKLPVS